MYAFAGVLFFIATGQPPPRGITDENQLKETVLQQIYSINPTLVIQNRRRSPTSSPGGLRVDPSRRLQAIDLLINDLEMFAADAAMGENSAVSL